jgi:hypothetical protein
VNGNPSAAAMGAWLWIASPQKWRSTARLSALDALRQYLASGYVYWATPILQEVAVGEPSYIWRTPSPQNKRNGIVAVGAVVEAPRFYKGRTRGIICTKIGLRCPAGMRAEPLQAGRPGYEFKTVCCGKTPC